MDFCTCPVVMLLVLYLHFVSFTCIMPDFLVNFGNFCRRWDSSTRLTPDEALQHEWIIEVCILIPDLFPCIYRV